MKKILFLIFTAFTFPVQAQYSEEEAIKQTINYLFEGMKKGDSALVRRAFVKDINLLTTLMNDGKPELRKEDLNDFLKAVGIPHKEIWDERIESWGIKIDGNMASVWTPYSFYLDNNFSHCGVNSFHLYKGENGWKIAGLMDTRRKQDCNGKKQKE